MNEVKKCSISGIAFTLDTDAYNALDLYLTTLKQTYTTTDDGEEIVADIEARIAELILSAQDGSRVVELPLVSNIIAQMGSVEEIDEELVEGSHGRQPRIPRRLYRDPESAKLGGVCAGVARYFDVDPVWVRLGIFLPLILLPMQMLPFMGWLGSLMGNLFGIFILCYLVMWFAVPTARSARQKLEMNGERITAESIKAATANRCDPDQQAKPIVAEVISLLGKVVIICLKILAGILVFGLIMMACALVIGMAAVMVGGAEILSPNFLCEMSLWLPVLAMLIVLIPVTMLIYVLMCLVASRKPGGKTMLIIFLLWIVSIVACASVAIHENAWGQIVNHPNSQLETLLGSGVVINGDSTTVDQLLQEDRTLESVIEQDTVSMRITVPSKSIDIRVNKHSASLEVTNVPEKAQ